MKSIFYPVLLVLTCLSVQAQKIIEKNLPYTAQQRIRLDLKFGDKIQLKAWNKSEVYVKVNVTINGGRLNDALLVDFIAQTDEIRIQSDYDKELIKKGRREDCPDSTGSRYNWDGDRDNYICSDISYEVYLPQQADIQVETISGNVEITGFAGPLLAKSISGFVDVNWPKNQGADLAMQSITGEVYSNLSIDFQNKQDKPSPVGYMLKGKVNGGGPKVRLESISNNVYLRAR